VRATLADKVFSYAPPGLGRSARRATHGLRRGLCSSAAPRLALRSAKKLIPDVSLVVGYVVLLQERDEFLLKRMLLMMFFLTGDIFCDCRNT